MTIKRHSAGLVGLGRVELPTSRLSGVRSNHLSYRPGFEVAASKHHQRKRSSMRRKRNEGGGVPHNIKTKPISRRSDLFIPKTNHDVQPKLGHSRFILRKEVIQPQVPLRLPCYDFTPVADLTVAGCLLAVSAPSSGKTNSHGVTGGVYKARERIHRGMLIHDY